MKGNGRFNFLMLMVVCCLQQTCTVNSTKRNMDTALSSNLTIRSKDGIWANIKMVNQTDHVVSVLEPNNFQPFSGWAYSNEAYQVAVLQSFHILKMTIFTKKNKKLEQNTISTLADHLFSKVNLQPTQELSLTIPLHEYYNLEKGVEYTLVIQYGRDTIEAYAKTKFKVE